jgi:hypothetical protein
VAEGNHLLFQSVPERNWGPVLPDPNQHLGPKNHPKEALKHDFIHAGNQDEFNDSWQVRSRRYASLIPSAVRVSGIGQRHFYDSAAERGPSIDQSHYLHGAGESFL